MKMKLIKSSPFLVVVGILLLVTVGIVSAQSNRWTLPESATPDTEYPHLPACDKYQLTDDSGSINECAYYKNEVDNLTLNLKNEKEEVARLKGLVADRDADLTEIFVAQGKAERISNLIGRGCVHYGNGVFSGTVDGWEVKCVNTSGYIPLHKLLKRDYGANTYSAITIKRKAYGDGGRYQYEVDGGRWFRYMIMRPDSNEVPGRWEIQIGGTTDPFSADAPIDWVHGVDCREVAVLGGSARCNKEYRFNRLQDTVTSIEESEYEYIHALILGMPSLFSGTGK